MSREAVSGMVLATGLVVLLVLAPDVPLLVFAGVLVAVFLRGGGGWIARRLTVREGWGLLIFCLALVLAFAVGGTVAAPFLAEQVDQLWSRIPEAVSAVRERLSDYAWGRELLGGLEASRLLGSAGRAASALSTTFGALAGLVIVLFLGLYLSVDPRPYRAGLALLFAPSLRPAATDALHRAAEALRGWLFAQLVSMTVVGLTTWLGLWFLGVPLAPVLALLAALLGFMPNIGPVLAAVPAVLLALTNGGATALWVVLLYVVVQTIESYLVTPYVQQEAVSLPPGLTISAQILFGILFGLLGMALATPFAAMALSLTRDFYVGRYLEGAAPPGRRQPGARPQGRFAGGTAAE